MGKLKPWHDDDGFWETMGPFLFAESRLSDAPQEVEDIISLLGLQPGARVLDLCCGVGRHSLELARRGFQVTGVDRTGPYLDRASRGAAEAGLAVEFVQDDMRKFCRPEAFDAVINAYTSFSYFEDPEEDRQVVLNVYHSLRRGGSFLMEMMGKEVLARIFRERAWEERDGVIILQEHKLSKNWGWIENRWIVLTQDGKEQEFQVCHRLYSAVELSMLLRDCGFGQVDAYGGLAGSPYDHTAKRLVVLARK